MYWLGGILIFLNAAAPVILKRGLPRSPVSLVHLHCTFQAPAVAAKPSALALDDECTLEESSAQSCTTITLCAVPSKPRCALDALQRRARTFELPS